MDSTSNRLIHCDGCLDRNLDETTHRLDQKEKEVEMLVCVTHGRRLVCSQNSVYAEQLTDGIPYQIWSSDIWQCPEWGCDTSILVTAAQAIVQYHDEGRYRPLAERVQERFE